MSLDTIYKVTICLMYILIFIIDLQVDAVDLWISAVSYTHLTLPTNSLV